MRNLIHMTRPELAAYITRLVDAKLRWDTRVDRAEDRAEEKRILYGTGAPAPLGLLMAMRDDPESLVAIDGPIPTTMVKV